MSLLESMIALRGAHTKRWSEQLSMIQRVEIQWRMRISERLPMKMKRTMMKVRLTIESYSQACLVTARRTRYRSRSVRERRSANLSKR